MKTQIFLPADTHLNTLTNLIECIVQTVKENEKDEQVLENMISDRPWSLVSWLNSGFLNEERTGRLYLTVDTQQITSISCSYVNEPRVLGLDRDEYRIGCRMWIHPRARFKLYPTVHHILPAITVAKNTGKSVVWTSFNEDRAGLGHKIERLKSTVDTLISSTWKDWIVKYDPVEVNNTMQSVAYCKL